MSSGETTHPICRHIRQPVRRSRLWESTNLSLIEDGPEETFNRVLGAPKSNNQQRVDSIKGARIDEHVDDSDGPEVSGVDNVATIKLGELALGTWAGERSVKQRTDQTTNQEQR